MSIFKFLLAFFFPIFLFGVSYSPKRAPWLPFVSGDGFRAYSDYVFDEEECSLRFESMKPYSTIFVKTDYLETFFYKFHPSIPCKYILITHNSDHPTPGLFAPFLEDEKLVAWFAQNVEDKTHPKLHPIPIGIANRVWPHGNGSLIQKIQAKQLPKKHLLYVNFTVLTYPQERQLAYNLLSRAPFSYCAEPKQFELYLHDIASCVFVASPRGNGLDTHRFWEALYLGAYPIVKTSASDSLYAGLPVVIIEDWHEVTKELLRQKHEEFLRKTYSLDRLYMPYWMNLIDSYKCGPKP